MKEKIKERRPWREIAGAGRISREIPARAKAWISAGVVLPILMVIMTMLLGQVGNFVSIKTGFLEETDALTTTCLTGVVMSVALWGIVPLKRKKEREKEREKTGRAVKPKKPGWALWWRSITIGILIVGCAYAGDSAFRVMEVATVVASSVVANSHLSAASRIVVEWRKDRRSKVGPTRRSLRDLRWLGISLCGVLLLSPPGAMSPKGLLLVGASSVAYHVGQKFKGDLPDDDLDTYSALARLPMVPIHIALLVYFRDGVAAIVSMGWSNLLICFWAGVAGSVINLLRNTAWKKGVRALAESMLNPLAPAITALVGTLAGQALPWLAFVGIALIVLSSIGGARSELHRQKAAGQPQGSG
ncbi:hypothetical protein ACQEU6_28155 [Spirillospora sp. CA-108201]